MKPCDCKTLQDCDALKEQGLAYNNYSIGVDSMGVILTIDPYCRMKFAHSMFKRFCEWYLNDQAKEAENGRSRNQIL